MRRATLIGVAAMLWLLGTAAVAADAIPGEDFCSGPIDRIEFEGNRRTREFVLLREALTVTGEQCSLDNIVDSTQSIMDLRLFKKVLPRLSMRGDDLILTYKVVEKIYFLPLPRFSRTSDGELRYGMQLRWDNYAGLHHQVRLTAEQRRQSNGTGRKGEVLKFSYTVPRFLSSNFGMSVRLNNSIQQTPLKQDEIIFGESEQKTDHAGLVFSRWLNQRGTTRGLSYDAGVMWQRRIHQLQSGQLGPFEEGQDVVLHFGVVNRQERDDLYRLRGYSYGIDFNLSSRATGSDYSYNATNLFFIHYLPVDKNGLRNLNYRISLGYSNGGPFGERLYSLGGGDTHRGLKSGTSDGDILTLFNVEYLIGLNSYPSFRWALFTDIGNVFAHNKFKPFAQKIGVGAGFRWKVLALSNTDLRVDVAFSEELEQPRLFLSSSLTF